MMTIKMSNIINDVDKNENIDFLKWALKTYQSNTSCTGNSKKTANYPEKINKNNYKMIKNGNIKMKNKGINSGRV